MCHFLFLLPFVALGVFFFLPPGQATIVSLPIFLLLLWLSWVTWRDVKRPVTTGIEGMIGGKAQAVDRTKDRVKVLLRGELWDAVCSEDLSVGETVRVTGLDRMKLIVRKESH